MLEKGVVLRLATIQGELEKSPLADLAAILNKNSDV